MFQPVIAICQLLEAVKDPFSCRLVDFVFIFLVTIILLIYWPLSLRITPLIYRAKD